MFDRLLNTPLNEIWDRKKEGNNYFPDRKVCLAYGYFFHWFQAGYAYKCYAYKKKHVFPLRSPFWPAPGLMLFMICFSKQKSNNSKRWFHREKSAWNISCEDSIEITSLFRLDSITAIFSFYGSIFWLKIAIMHETLSINVLTVLYCNQC